MTHDFKKFPELTNNQMQFYYFESPHRQATQDFWAKVTKVIDGDTVKVKWTERSFEFPIRIDKLAAPEMKEDGGEESKSWLEKQVLGKEVFIILSSSRVEKWGRLLADIMTPLGTISNLSVITGHAKPWGQRNEGIIQ